jgi:DNA mismatch endonuclease (patch repair protein)
MYIEYWGKKFACNQNRDATVKSNLTSLGWRVIIIWECELLHPDIVKKSILKQIGQDVS